MILERKEREFLSTLSLRRATCCTVLLAIIHRTFLSTLSLRRATAVCNQLIFDTLISIHALLAESDFRAPTRAL